MTQVGVPSQRRTPHPRCDAATSRGSACQGLADDLHERYALPSIYLLVDGRLRCQAARGYFQVVDGFTSAVGVIGRVVAGGVPVVIRDVRLDPDFIAAVPGLVAAATLPVRVHGEVVGAVTVESTSALPDDVEDEIGAAADALGQAIERLGGMPPVPLAQRLARIAVGLTALTDAGEIRARAVEGARQVSGMSSAVLSEQDADGCWAVTTATGPLVDVDHFKAVNDSFGHVAGDRLLCALAEELRAHLRDDAVLYRVGGDEMAVLLHADEAEASVVAQRLVDAARRVRTTVSIGVALVGGLPPTVARLRADRALYLAKAQGRDRFVAAGPDL